MTLRCVAGASCATRATDQPAGIGNLRVARCFNKVVLPMPFGPSKPYLRPFAKVRSASDIKSMPGADRVKPFTETASPPSPTELPSLSSRVEGTCSEKAFNSASQLWTSGGSSALACFVSSSCLRSSSFCLYFSYARRSLLDNFSPFSTFCSIFASAAARRAARAPPVAPPAWSASSSSSSASLSASPPPSDVGAAATGLPRPTSASG
mmetsp:Transcript_40123/g.105801  ORF Transcript_40123/g.105801 Transcript_40123/m.105801 type:complete len:208 (+) Transcript_40123:530-1153(+)